MIVAIDGPAGAGKSTVTRGLAERLGFCFLDTGAMYRAVTWSALDQGLDLSDHSALRQIAEGIEITFDGDLVLVNGKDVSSEIRQPFVTRQVGKIADAPSVRSYLVELQRRIAATGDFVCEGRDQGTVAFPDAFCKIFLTASSRSRALRRASQMQARGDFVDFDQIVHEQDIRDQQDLKRDVGGLKQAHDATVVNTDHQTLEEVVSHLEKIVRKRLTEIGDRNQ